MSRIRPKHDGCNDSFEVAAWVLWRALNLLVLVNHCVRCEQFGVNLFGGACLVRLPVKLVWSRMKGFGRRLLKGRLDNLCD